MNYNKMKDYDIILLTQAIIDVDMLRAAMDCEAIKGEFYQRFPEIDLSAYEQILLESESITLCDFIQNNNNTQTKEREYIMTVREKCSGWAIGDRVIFTKDKIGHGIKKGDLGTIVNIHDNQFEPEENPANVIILVRTDKPMPRQVIYFDESRNDLKYIWDEKCGLTFTSKTAKDYIEIVG